MEGPTTAILHQRRSDELMKSSLPPSPTSPPSSQHKVIVTPVSEGNPSGSALPPSPPMPRKPVSRQQSITRGTASSIAKAVRSNHIMNPTINTDHSNNIPQRRLSVRNRKQSLTNMDTSRLLVTGSADNLSVLSRRRSSWSPFTPVNQTNASDRKTPSPSQLSPDTLRKQQEELDHSTNISPSPFLAKKAMEQGGDTTIKDIKVSTSPTTMTTSSSASSSLSTRVHSSCSKKTSNTNAKPGFFKFDDDATPHAASLENNQQTQKSNIIPLETPPPDDDEEVLNIRLESGPDQQQTATHHHHHHHHHHLHHNPSDSSDDDLPGYMRRPICAACNRNVKVTSSTESLTHLKSSASNSTNNSRRSSISASSTTAAAAAASSSTKNHMTKSRSAVSSSSTEENVKVTATIATDNDKNALNAIRPHSPTSPIPTTQRIGERKKSILADISHRTNDVDEESHIEKEQETVSLYSDKKRQCSNNSSNSGNNNSVINEDKWNELLNQQKKLLEFINRDSTTTTTAMTLTSSSSAATHNNNKIDETDILKTQMELLKRFEAILMLSSLPSPAPTANTTTTTVQTTMEHPMIENRSLPIASWQTKVEYSLTRFKWNMSQWFGTIVGTGNIEEQDFDTLGYTKNVVISGVCVTTEPGLLPKNLQKYYRLYGGDTVICHKYLIHLTRENRLSTFATSTVWDEDDKVHRCSFSIRGKTHTKYCSIEFGAFHRRHHCRSCGHIFCQTHSSNCLPLFVNNGEERGEWSRVCDSCFYARIEPQFIARS